MRKELRASLDDAWNRVAELETQNLDPNLEIDSLKASPIVFDEVDFVVISMFSLLISLLLRKIMPPSVRNYMFLGLRWLSYNLDLLC
jgi:hypothetical protein